MNPRVRLLIVAVLLAGAGAAAFALGGHTPKPAAPKGASGSSTSVLPHSSLSAGACIEAPPEIAMPAWLPADMPLPGRFHAVEYKLPKLAGFRSYEQAMFIVERPLSDFVPFVLTEWRKRGWEVSRGDSEPGEAENGFVNNVDKRFGAFRANSTLCDQNKTLVWIVVAKL